MALTSDRSTSQTDDPCAAIDAVMERASRALEDTDYFDAERLCCDALRRALAVHAFERMSRIVMPLLESRRQIRQLALDCVLASGGTVPVVSREAELGGLHPGCYILQPPMIGADGRSLRQLSRTRRSPVVLLTREPMTRTGQWPIVAVGQAIILRTQVAPPAGVEPAEGITRDRLTNPVPLAWLQAAIESLGDSALSTVDPDEPAAHRVEDLLDRVDALPEHEKLHQRLAETCHEAMHEPLPELPRRRGLLDDPFSF